MTSPTLLGTGGHSAGGESYGGKYYANVSLGRCPTFPGGFTTEAYVSQTIRVPGTVSYLSWRLDAPFGSTLTLTLNKNSSATALAISVSAVTGWVTDSTDVVNVSNGDTLDFAADVGSETSFTHSFYCVSARFDASTGGAQLLASVGSSDDQFAPGMTPQFVPLLGIAAFPSQTETDKQVECVAAGNWQNMACYLGSNGFNMATTITNRKNWNSGVMAISIPLFVSGSFEDIASSNKDRINAGDLLDYQFVAFGSGNGAYFELAWIGAHFLFGSATQSMIGGSSVSPSRIPSSLNPSETTYESSLFGGGNPAPSIPRATGLLPYASVASKYTNHITAASQPPNGGAATFTLLRNGTPSSLAASSAAGQTGYFTDNADTVALAVGDTCANRIVLTSNLNTTYVFWAGAVLLLEASPP